MLRIENRPYDNRNPTPILIPIPISVSPPLAKELKNHYHLPILKIQEPRVKTKNQWIKTQESRTMSLCHTISLYSKFKGQESKTKTKEPRLKSQEQWAMGRNQHQRARPIEPRFKIPNNQESNLNPNNQESRTKNYEPRPSNEGRLKGPGFKI